jgi:hypothetical protein
VPMFWSGGVKNPSSGEAVSMRATLGPSILGIAFGAMHCIEWSYPFPSHAELVLWHISCLAMMIVPFLSAVVCAYMSAGDENSQLDWIINWFVILLILSAWLYVAARIATILMAFTTLRALPSEAFTVVDWTSFIPHI